MMPFAEYYIFATLVLLPVAYIFRRAGFNPLWAALLGIPDVGFTVCVSVLALRKWRV